MPRFDPAEFGRVLACLTPHELRQAEGCWWPRRANGPRRSPRVMPAPRRAVQRHRARAAGAASGSAGAGRERVRSDGAVPAAGRPGRGGATHRSPACIDPT